MTTQELIELAGQRIVEAAGSPAMVILFGSAARGELTRDSDLDFLVIEREVENRVDEAVRLRDAVGRVGWPVDVIVMDEDLAARRAKGTWDHGSSRNARGPARCPLRRLSSASTRHCCLSAQRATSQSPSCADGQQRNARRRCGASTRNKQSRRL